LDLYILNEVDHFDKVCMTQPVASKGLVRSFPVQKMSHRCLSLEWSGWVLGSAGANYPLVLENSELWKICPYM